MFDSHLEGRLDGGDDGERGGADDDLLETIPLVPRVDEPDLRKGSSGLSKTPSARAKTFPHAVFPLDPPTFAGGGGALSPPQLPLAHPPPGALTSFPRVDLKSLILGFLIWGSAILISMSACEIVSALGDARAHCTLAFRFNIMALLCRVRRR